MMNHTGAEQPKFLPKRIILVRHGESAGNLDGSAYATTPDYKIPLTQDGIQQAKLAGKQIRDVISGSGKLSNWKACFYVSPYERTRSTLREIGRSFPKKRVIGVKEECRIREQDFGNFQITERMKVIKETREKFGRFFYRFPEGFLESLWRDIDTRLHYDPSDDLNIIIVSHGLASRVFLMKWFKWTVEQFEYLNNLNNCEFRVMQLGDSGDYSLAVHHSDKEMREWGLSEQMIDDQKRRAKGAPVEKSQWYLDGFFDQLDEDSDSDDGDNKDHQTSDKTGS